MKIETLQKCKREVYRFLEEIDELERLHKNGRKGLPPECFHLINTGRQNAAVKRASMDLTRSLADLRAGR